MLHTDRAGPLFLMIDSGSTISLIGADTLKSDEGISPVPITVSSITGDKLPVMGKVTVRLAKEDASICKHVMVVTSGPQMKNFDGILGADWM
jgi:hypothetical protein